MSKPAERNSLVAAKAGHSRAAERGLRRGPEFFGRGHGPSGNCSPAEFFAVATESFFERPHHLAATLPEAYAELSSYYRMNPLVW